MSKGRRGRRLHGLAAGLAALVAACIPDVPLKLDGDPEGSTIGTGTGSGTGAGAGGGGCSVDRVERGAHGCEARRFTQWNLGSFMREGLAADIVDLDRDGFSDTVVGYQVNDKIAIFWGGPTLESLTQVVYDGGGRPSGVVVHGDFDEDGQLDFAVPAQDQGEIWLYRQTSPREFELSNINQENRSEMVVFDGNGDGHADLLVRTTICNFFRPGDGNGDFPASQGHCYGGLSTDDALTAGDLDCDGKDELVVKTFAGEWKRFAPTSEGAVFVEDVGASLLGDAAVTEPRIHDIDGDGRAELMAFVLPKRREAFLARTRDDDTLAFDECFNLPLPAAAYAEGIDVTKYLRFKTAGDINGDKQPDYLLTNVCAYCPTVHYFMVSAP